MAVNELVAIGIIEKDSRDDVLWTWSYPTVNSDQREIFLRKSCLSSEHGEGEGTTLRPFVYSQYQRQWYYIFSMRVHSSALPKVTHISLVLLAKDFNPEKYEVLTSLLAKVYQRTGNPADLLDNYLAVITRGSCTGEQNGTFVARDFDAKQAYATTAIRDVIAKFGIEIILLYSAMLLKKRIVLFHSDVEELLIYVRTLPAFVWHRQNWNVLYPYVFIEDLEISPLQSLNHFVAGFTDPSIQHMPELFDMFVNISTSEIIISTHAKESFGLGKLHKDLATSIVQSAEDESKSDHQIIKDIANKTKELLNNLKSLSTTNSDGKPIIQLEKLRERKMAASTENFLFNLAAAEGLVAT